MNHYSINRSPEPVSANDDDRQSAHITLSQGEGRVIKQDSILVELWKIHTYNERKYLEFVANNQWYVQLGIQQHTAHIFLLLPLVAIFVFDLIFSRSVGEFFAEQFFPPGSIAITITVIAIPLLYVLFEIGVSLQAYASAEAAAADPFDRAKKLRRNFWLGLSVLMAMVMPLLFIATFIAGHEGEDLWGFKAILLVGMTILIAILHLAVLFSGKPVIQAKESLIAGFKYRHLRRRWVGSRRALIGCNALLDRMYLDYLRRAQDFNRVFGQNAWVVMPPSATAQKVRIYLNGDDAC
jgi:hypothetical protein